MALKRTLVHLTEDQYEALRKLSYDTKLTMSDHIRKALEAYLKDKA